ncbi:MAG: hypothetical protein ABIS38_06940 [Sphingomicrobium sp.]
MKVPTPLRGWRAFAGEVGVIMLGVLLALAAQQVVENIRVDRDVRTFRETIDREIAYNLWVYRGRDIQTECTERRLRQLARWLDRSQDGRPAALVDTSYPYSFSEYRSAWDNRDADVFATLPHDIRRKYAEFYDELANNFDNRRAERDVWGDFLPYEVRAPLTIADQRVLHKALKQAQGRNQRIHENLVTSFAIGKTLGIKPIKPDGMTPEEVAATRRCPILARPTVS